MLNLCFARRFFIVCFFLFISVFPEPLFAAWRCPQSFRTVAELFRARNSYKKLAANLLNVSTLEKKFSRSYRSETLQDELKKRLQREHFYSREEQERIDQFNSELRPLLDKQIASLLLSVTKPLYRASVSAINKIDPIGEPLVDIERVSGWEDGKASETILIRKLRSMKHVDSLDRPFSTEENDSRFMFWELPGGLKIPFSKLIRVSGIDELPQLEQVRSNTSELSLVGFRPTTEIELQNLKKYLVENDVETADQFETVVHLRHSSQPPGIIGANQAVSGRGDSIHDPVHYYQKIHRDLIDSISFAQDPEKFYLESVALTIRQLLTGHGRR